MVDEIRRHDDENALDPAEVAPLFAALSVSSGDARATILEALVRLPLAAVDMRKLGIAPPAQVPSLRPAWTKDAGSGFASCPALASADLDARLAALEPPKARFWSVSASPPLEEEVAPAAVTHWFARAVGDYADIGLGNDIVGWVSAYDGLFRPDVRAVPTRRAR